MDQSEMFLYGFLIACYSWVSLDFTLLFFPSIISIKLPDELLAIVADLVPLARIGIPFFLICSTIASLEQRQIKNPSTQKKARALHANWFTFLVPICLVGLGVCVYGPYFPGAAYLYPISVVISTVVIPVLLPHFYSAHSWGIKGGHRLVNKRGAFHLKTTKGYINISNPFGGIAVFGAPGSGKSYSVAEPLIEQALQMNYTGILYDYKFPDLTDWAHTAYLNSRSNKKVIFRVINFTDLSRSCRINPLAPENLPTPSYAREFAEAIMKNLFASKQRDYWSQSATSLLAATIWYLKKYYPELSSLPHLVAIIAHRNFPSFIPKIAQDIESGPMIADLAGALAMGADKQAAGVLGNLQSVLAALNTPEIFWVMSGNDFSLKLNHKDHASFLCLGSSPLLANTLAPVISLIITAAFSQMTSQQRMPSIVLLDEAPTIHIPDFQRYPATVRSYKIATIFMAQDLSQIQKQYGADNTKSILSTLNNLLVGRVSQSETAEYVSKLFGKEFRKSVSSSISSGKQGSKSQSVQFQKDLLLEPHEAIDLERGEFLSITVNPLQKSRGVINRKKGATTPLPAFAKGFDIDQNFREIHEYAECIVKGIF